MVIRMRNRVFTFLYPSTLGNKKLQKLRTIFPKPLSMKKFHTLLTFLVSKTLQKQKKIKRADRLLMLQILKETFQMSHGH